MLCKIIYVLVIGILEQTSARKNVLFVISDDLRPQLGSYYGSDFPTSVHPPVYTPNIDAFASRSLLLKRAYVQQAVCSPSRTSFLTGRRPDTTHVYDLVEYFRTVGGNFTTLPQLFKQHGYRSFGIGKIFHPGKPSGYDDPESWTEPYYQGENNAIFEGRNHSWLAVPDDELVGNPLRDRLITDKAKETLRLVAPKARTGEENFFIALGFRRPHLPFSFPASMLKFYNLSDIHLPQNPFAPAYMPNIAWYESNELREQYADIRRLNYSGDVNTTLPDDVVLNLRRAYYCSVTFIDMLFGEVMAELESLGLADNTIVSFIGDHGWHLGEHGVWGKVTNFEIATHSPMMIRIPGLTDHGIQSEMLTEFVDLYPTIVQAAGLGSVPQCGEDSSNTAVCHEGASLLPLITDPGTAIKHATFSQYPRIDHIMGYSVRTDRYRYTEWVEFSYTTYKPDWNTVYGVELYYHLNDPDENFNAAYEPEFRKARASLRDLLHRGWRHSLPGQSSFVG